MKRGINKISEQTEGELKERLSLTLFNSIKDISNDEAGKIKVFPRHRTLLHKVGFLIYLIRREEYRLVLLNLSSCLTKL